MTRPGTGKSSDGMAMIMVLVMVIIFASLILAVVISSTTAIRRAHYYKDKAVALQIAESGLQEILFKMNYENYESGGVYPFGDGSVTETQVYPFGTTDFATIQVNPDGTGGDTRLVSTGKYKGRMAQVQVDLRGHALTGESLNNIDNGIADAFTKKTIYAAQVLFPTALPGGRIIKGNVTTTSSKPSPFPWTEATWTETNLTPENFRLKELVRFETSVCQFTLPAFTGADDIYSDTGLLYNTAYPGGVDVNTLNNGVYWNGSAYLLGRATDGTSSETFIANNRRVLVNADVVVPAGITEEVTINGYFRATGDITINSAITTTTGGNFAIEVLTGKTFTLANNLTINGDLVVKANDSSIPLSLVNATVLGSVAYDGDITVSGTSDTLVAGNMLSRGNITVSSSVDMLRVEGSMVCSNDTTPMNHTINIQAQTEIDATSSLYDAALIIYPVSDPAYTSTINISASTDITLGENQKAAILVSAANGIININNVTDPLSITYAQEPPDQFAIVNFSGRSGIAEVNIYTNNLSLRGSIYSYRDITLNDSTQYITGILIAGDELSIGSNSRIVYEPDSYLNPTVYKGFTAGRRRYIPLPGSWEVVW